MDASEPPPSRQPVDFFALAGPGISSVRRLWRPFLLLQFLGLLLVVGYFVHEPTRAACDALGRLKEWGGLPLSAIAMAFSAGVMPEVFKFLSGVDRTISRARLNDLLFHAMLYGFCGIVVDSFYVALNWLLADVRGWWGPLLKMLIDQFLYSPFIAIPLIAGLFTWRECGFSVGRLRRTVGLDWYLRKGIPLLLTSWAYWIPMSLLMYTLPPKLTFCFAVVANAASATLLTAVATRKDPPAIDALAP